MTWVFRQKKRLRWQQIFSEDTRSQLYTEIISQPSWMWKHCAKSRKLPATLPLHWPGLRRPLSRNASVKPGSGLDCRVRYQYHVTPQTKSIFLNVGTFPRKTKHCNRLFKGEYVQRCIMARNLSPRYIFKLAITSTLYTLIRVDTPLNRRSQRFVFCRPPRLNRSLNVDEGHPTVKGFFVMRIEVFTWEELGQCMVCNEAPTGVPRINPSWQRFFTCL